MAKKRTQRIRRRLDIVGTLLLAVLLGATLALAVPHVSAGNKDKNDKKLSGPPGSTDLDKKFKGRLPITELTEDEAIMHAFNRLAYGPSPGDVDRIRKMGLEKWVDQQ